MSGAIDTEITGAPAGVHALADALRVSCARALDRAGDSLVTARRVCADSWSSAAGEAFSGRVSYLGPEVDVLAGLTTTTANGLDLLAGEIERCQRAMEGIRSDASSAGLQVDGNLILEPGPHLPDPATPVANADPVTVQAFAEESAAADAQRKKIEAFTRADAESKEVRTQMATAARVWANVVSDWQKKKALTISDFALGGVVGAAIAYRGENHRRAAKAALKHHRSMLATLGSHLDPATREAVLNRMSAVMDEAKLGQETWRNSNSLGQKVAFRGGGLLAAGGVVYDVAVLDKPWHQAAISGGASFGASVAAGAAIGTMVPVPVVGTVLGAAGGAVVGIFTSGAVDSMFQNQDSDVASAIDAGAAAITDAGKAVGNAGKSVWNALF